MSPRRRFVHLALAVAILTSGFIIAPPEPVTAMPERQLFCTYYSDATYTTVVGERWVSCTGVILTGTRTAYEECWQGGRCYTPLRCSDAPWCDPYWQVCC